MSGPHDKLFKKSFENPTVAAAHFRDSLPAEVVPMLDWARLRLEPGSYIDETLSERHSDLLFSAPWTNSNASETKRTSPGSRRRRRQPDSALLYLLFEQQSTIDRLMPLRMLRYVLRIWERWLADNSGARLLPAVFPLVVYNGKTRWSAPVCMEDLLNVPEALKSSLLEFMPRLRIALQSLRDFEPTELPGDVHGRLVLSFLRTRHTDDMLPHYLNNILTVKHLPMPERLQVFERLLHYSWMVSGTTDRRAYIERAAQIGPEALEIAMTYGERLIAQGRSEVLQNAKQLVVKTLESRGLTLSSAARNHIAACDDVNVVLRWTARSGLVDSVGELFEH